jgi:hypothetical protein
MATIPLQTQENKIEVFKAEMTKELNDSMSQIQGSAEHGIKTFTIIYISYTDRIRDMSRPSIVINIELELNREDAAFINVLGIEYTKR